VCFVLTDTDMPKHCKWGLCHKKCQTEKGTSSKRGVRSNGTNPAGYGPVTDVIVAYLVTHSGTVVVHAILYVYSGTSLVSATTTTADDYSFFNFYLCIKLCYYLFDTVSRCLMSVLFQHTLITRIVTVTIQTLLLLFFIILLNTCSSVCPVVDC